jgi:hypothetical protein
MAQPQPQPVTYQTVSPIAQQPAAQVMMPQPAGAYYAPQSAVPAGTYVDPSQGAVPFVYQQPMAGQPQPMTLQPQPMAGQPQPMAGQPQPMAGQPQPIAGQPQTVAGQQQTIAELPAQPVMVYQQGGVVPGQPGMIVMAPQPGVSYQTVMPIASLGAVSAPISCPNCRQTALTSLNYIVGDCTQ